MDTITTIQSLLTCNGSAQPVTVSLTPNDSRLIAAAPTLLEALEQIEKRADIQDGDDLVRECAHILACAQAALARAKVQS